MDREQLDRAKPMSVDAASDYYRLNLAAMKSSVSTSTLNSISHEKNQELNDCCSSSTASDSEIEEQHENNEKLKNNEHKTDDIEKPEQTSAKSDLQSNTKLHNINSVKIENSNDVHIGNKTFFNGPVTIKNIVLSNDNVSNSSGALGVSNQGFVGSLNNVSPKHNSFIQNKREEEIEIAQADKQISDFARHIFARRKILCIIGTVLIIVVVVILLMLKLPLFKDDINETTNNLEIISRKEWDAHEIHDTLDDLVLPLKRVIICHTVTSSCDTKEECPETVKRIQELHLGLEFNFSDIAYNFLIGGDGNVYEGRGWYKQGAHTSGYNRGSLGIAYIGNFVSELPNEKQLAAGFKLFAEGLKIEVLDENYVIYGASQLRTTESPGGTFLELIKTWPHAFQDTS